MGAMSLLVLLEQRMILMFDMYFSIVRRSAACASRVNESASLIITTVNIVQFQSSTPSDQSEEARLEQRTLESLFGVQINLLCLCYLLQDLLDDHSIIYSHITKKVSYHAIIPLVLSYAPRGDLNMKIALYNIHIELPL